MASVRNTYRFLRSHPLTRERTLPAIGRFVRWQVASRLMGGEFAMPWVNGTVLLMARGRTGATGNWYAGLHEFPDMGFVLHLLRPGDLFMDVGANIGSFTVLAAGAAGADAIAVEPGTEAMRRLAQNVRLNDLSDRVRLVEAALGAAEGCGHLTEGLDTMNRLVSGAEEGTTPVRLTTVDRLVDGRAPMCIKIDVEGGEHAVLAGAASTLADPRLLALIVEVNASDAAEGYTRAALEDLLAGRGFEPCGYDPLSRSLLAAPLPGAGNTIYLRDREAVATRLREAPRFRILGRDV